MTEGRGQEGGPPGVRPVSHSPGGLREPRRGAPPGGSTDQVVPGVATLE